jgi:phosphoglycolate phosphatase-like HAD superfamily hydrolase
MKKLVLFDIDGTLIYHVGKQVKPKDRFHTAVEEVYGVTVDMDVRKFEGIIDKGLAWNMLRGTGISQREFEEKFPAYVKSMHRYLIEVARFGETYVPIEDAHELVQRLHGRTDAVLGILTGNAESIAKWKLTHTGLSRYFTFGLYGDEADDRVALAKLAFRKAEALLHHRFRPQETAVIGDTVHDIRCGKAIGAATVAVMTGMHNSKSFGGNGTSRALLKKEKPDLLVDTLMDRRVLEMFGIS